MTIFVLYLQTLSFRSMSKFEIGDKVRLKGTYQTTPFLVEKIEGENISVVYSTSSGRVLRDQFNEVLLEPFSNADGSLHWIAEEE